MLVDLLLNASRMGMDLAGALESVDLNPIVVWGDQHRVLDAKVIWRRAQTGASRRCPPAPSTSRRSSRPAASRVVGASATPGKMGYAVLDSLVNYDYPGKVYPINPGRDEIMGANATPPSPPCPTSRPGGGRRRPGRGAGADRRMRRAGIHNMVIVSGGGKELGGDKVAWSGRSARRPATTTCASSAPTASASLTGTPGWTPSSRCTSACCAPSPARMAMITQSGTVGCIFLESCRLGRQQVRQLRQPCRRRRGRPAGLPGRRSETRRSSPATSRALRTAASSWRRPGV